MVNYNKGKDYTSYENDKMFHVIYEMVKDNEALREKCRTGYVNKHNIHIINELKNYIHGRSDTALAIQVSLVVCGIWYPERKWGQHSRALMFNEMYENLKK